MQAKYLNSYSILPNVSVNMIKNSMTTSYYSEMCCYSEHARCNGSSAATGGASPQRRRTLVQSVTWIFIEAVIAAQTTDTTS